MPKRPSRKTPSRSEKPVEDISAALQKSKRIYSAVVCVRSPSKRCEAVCKQLRKILTPECLSKMEINPKLQDVADVSSELLIKQIIYISEHNITIASLPNGPTHTFKIVEYDDNFKNYPSDLYRTVPFITFEGKSSLKTVFQSFGTEDSLSKRVVHFHFQNDLTYIRHYSVSTVDTDDNFVVRLKEIGPRLTLQLTATDNGVLPGSGIKFNRRRRQD